MGLSDGQLSSSRPLLYNSPLFSAFLSSHRTRSAFTNCSLTCLTHSSLCPTCLWVLTRFIYLLMTPASRHLTVYEPSALNVSHHKRACFMYFTINTCLLCASVIHRMIRFLMLNTHDTLTGVTLTGVSEFRVMLSHSSSHAGQTQSMTVKIESVR